MADGRFASPSQFIRVTPFDMRGSPAAVAHSGTSPDSMPIGVQVAGPHWREDTVLAIAEFL